MTENKAEPFLYALAGIAVGAVIVYIFVTQTNLAKITEISRDANGHVISIIEKKL
jgi:hypothetical protein